MASFDLQEIKSNDMLEIDALVQDTKHARYMGICWPKKHRKDLIVSDILDNRLIHYNFDERRARSIKGSFLSKILYAFNISHLGQNNLTKPGACCFIEDPKDGRQLVCTIDHHGITVFDPLDDKLIYEVPLKNQPGMRLTGVFIYLSGLFDINVLLIWTIHRSLLSILAF